MTTTTDLLRRAARRHWNLAKSAPTGHAERITRDGNALDALADQMERAEPDCWAVSTPNGSRLVSEAEAKGKMKPYPLYTHPAPEVTRDAEPVLCESCKAIGAAYKIGREASIPAEVTRDAERYRWLRKHCAYRGTDITFGRGFNQTAPEGLDAAIDAALQEPKP